MLAIDASYDVPVKLGALHLLLATLFLLAPDARRLLAALLPEQPVRVFRAAWKRRLVIAAKAMFIGYAVLVTAFFVTMAYFHGGDGAKPRALDGLYEVESFTRNGEAIPPLTTNGDRWRWLGVRRERFVVKTMDDGAIRYEMRKKGDMLTLDGEDGARTFTFAQPDAEHLRLRGDDAAGALDVTLRRVDESKLLLESERGFHAVIERPLNR